jgi:hypothetical protein
MSEQEHPAAKAGRIVRAAGLALQRELEKKTAAAAARPVPVEAAPPPPPPPVPTTDFFGRAVFYSFVVSLVAFLLVVLRVEMVIGHHGGKTIFRLILAVVMFVEAYLLTSNWRRANQRLVQRVASKLWGPRAAATRREKFFVRLLRDALTLVGIVFLAAGTFELLGATVGY